MMKRLKGGAEVVEITVRRVLCCGFRSTLVKGWDKCINVGGGDVVKLMFFPGSNIAWFTFYIRL
jgi:hypothetical protein